MVTILAVPEDQLIASALREAFDAADTDERPAVSVLVCTEALASSSGRLPVISDALAAWEMSRLIVVRINDAPLPLGFADLPSFDLTMAGAQLPSDKTDALIDLLRRPALPAGDRETLSAPSRVASLDSSERIRLVQRAHSRVMPVALALAVTAGVALLLLLTMLGAPPPDREPAPTVAVVDKSYDSLLPEPELPRQRPNTDSLPVAPPRDFAVGGPSTPRAYEVIPPGHRLTRRLSTHPPAPTSARTVQELEAEIARLQREVEELKRQPNDSDLPQTMAPQRQSRAAAPSIAPAAPGAAARALDNEPPDDQTVQRLEDLAAGGNAVAQLALAIRLQGGHGVAQNNAEAVSWFEKAARQGLAVAQYRLGASYERGLGVTKDLSRARDWYERAAKQGNRKAMYNLAVLYADDPTAAQNPKLAARWFDEAANYGLTDSQYNLALMLERGMGVEKNLMEAAKWYAIASSAGDAGATDRLTALRRELNPADVAVALEAARAFKAKPLNSIANDAPESFDEPDTFEPAPEEFAPASRKPATQAESGGSASLSAVAIAAVVGLTLGLAGICVWLWRKSRQKKLDDQPLPLSAPRDAEEKISVFASYAHEDSARVDSILALVEGMPVSIWIDRKNLPGGARWPEEIVRAIRECRAFVIFCSQESFRSDDVFREVHIAGRLGKRLIPVALDNSAMPDQFLYFLAAQNIVQKPTDLGRALGAIA